MPLSLPIKDAPPRPKITSRITSQRTAEDLYSPFLDWLKLRGFRTFKTEDEIKLYLTSALTHHEDPFQITKWFEDRMSVEADEDLFMIFWDTQPRRRKYHQSEIADWVMKYRIRFPAGPKDAITYHRLEQGRTARRTGIVVAVDPISATAVVRSPSDKDRSADRVKAEDVVTLVASVLAK
jgi:hypothetical protein